MSHSETLLPQISMHKRSVMTLCILLCFLPLVLVLAPRGLGVLPAALGLVFFVSLRFQTGHWPPFNKTYLVLAITIPVLAAFSSLWALNAEFALERALKITFILAGGYALFAVLQNLKIKSPDILARVFPLSMLLALALCLFELMSGGVLYALFRGVESGTDKLSLAIMNRAVVGLLILVALALVFLAQAPWTLRRKTAVRMALLCLMGLVLLMTDSQSSQLAALVMAAFWFAFPVGRRKAWIGLSALLCAGIVGAPWLAQFLYQNFAAIVDGLPWLENGYASHRLEIWDFVARKALESPLYGFGIEATRHVSHFDTPLLYTTLDHVLHPHNAVLQIWIEFGIIGALALCVFITVMLHNIAKLAADKSLRDESRLCLTIFAGVLAVSCTGYGLWQGWWLGLLTLLAALCGHLVYRGKHQKGRL